MQENVYAKANEFCEHLDISNSSLGDLWERFLEAVDFREKIYSDIQQNNVVFSFDIIKKLTHTESKIFHALLEQGKQSFHQQNQYLENTIHLFEQKIRHCANHIIEKPFAMIAQLRGYATEILWLKYLAVSLEENNYHSMLADILSEIHIIESQANLVPTIFENKDFKEVLDNLQNISSQKEFQSFEQQAEELINQTGGLESKLDELLEAMFWGNHIQSHSNQSIQELCKEKCKKILKSVTHKFHLASHEQKCQFLEDFVLEMEESVQDIVGNADDKKLANSITNLEQIYNDSEWLKELAKIAIQEKEIEKKVAKIVKKITKIQRYLQAEIQEKKLQYRMEGILGKTATTILETTILILTLLVIVLLFVENKVRFSNPIFQCDPQYAKFLDAGDSLHDNPEPLPKEFIVLFTGEYLLSEQIKVKAIAAGVEWEVEDIAKQRTFIVFAESTPDHVTILQVYAVSPLVWWFVILDLTICFIFLFEFFLKWSLCQGRWLYFRRHFLIDVLPSIPFGWLALSLESLDYTRSARLFRLLRLQRMIRYIRILRPIIRVFRVVMFLLRGIDRLVHRYSKWLNRNVIFFDYVSKDALHSLQHRIQKLRNECLGYSKDVFQQYPSNTQMPYILPYLYSLQIQLNESGATITLKQKQSNTSDLAIENIVETLLNIRGSEVEDILGDEFPTLVHKYFGLLDSPVIRHIPGIKKVVVLHRQNLPTEFTAILCRGFGRILEKFLSLIYWLCDLYGIVTGPRILDRIAKTLVESFQKPAKKLLMIGSFFLLMNLLVNMLPWPIWHKILGLLNRYVGLPLFIIGGLCTIPLCLGWWLKNLAGKATDFYERTSEAQFINLLKEIKWVNVDNDIKFLHERVLDLEISIAQLNEEQKDSRKESLANIREKIFLWQNPKAEASENQHERLYHQVAMLYRDYLDGSVLHRRDVKTTKQFLGNLTLCNIRNHRLAYTRKQLKELEKLDLDKPRLFSGPYLWFNLVTDTISQNTAQLIIEYNRHAIPIDMQSVQSKDIQGQYQDWLSDRKNFLLGNVDTPPSSENNTNAIYLTTHFTALHFLSCHPTRDQEIRRNFGNDLYELFLQDRRKMILDIFGSYPLPKLPRSRRTFNPYRFYQNNMAGGKIFLLPFKAVWLIMIIIGGCICWVYHRIREIMNPLNKTELTLAPISDSNVILRKIHRMRKPIYMATMNLRAIYDVEYLGLSIAQSTVNSEKLGIVTEPLFEQDLKLISAFDEEYDAFIDLENQRKLQLHQLNLYLQQTWWDGKNFFDYLQTFNPNIQKHRKEILRAITIAYCINYKKLANLLEARQTLNMEFERTIRNEGKIEGHFSAPSFCQKIKDFCRSMLKNFRKDDYGRFAWEQIWRDLGYGLQYGEQEKQWCWNAYLAKRHSLEKTVLAVERSGGILHTQEIMLGIIQNPIPWTEELVALRTIQTLAIMDIQNYQKHVAELSGH